jgi:pimeloyl-ACP methyl ester carboxylesterase
VVATPVFVAAALVRTWPELRRARGGWLAALRTLARQCLRVLAHPASPRAMRRRLAWWVAIDREADARRVQAPTLVLAGEPALDRVVPVDGTREYASCIPGARLATLENTGHVAVITQPDRFAEIVSAFVEERRVERDAPSTTRSRDRDDGPRAGRSREGTMTRA